MFLLRDLTSSSTAGESGTCCFFILPALNLTCTGPSPKQSWVSAPFTITYALTPWVISTSAVLVASYAYVQALDIRLPGLGYG
jgi:hypothetical protein